MIRRKESSLKILARLNFDDCSKDIYEELECPTFSPALFRRSSGANLIQKPILGKRPRIQSGDSLSDGELDNYEAVRKLKTPIFEPKLFFTRDMNFPGFARALTFGSLPKQNSSQVTGFAYPTSPSLLPRKTFFAQKPSTNENYCGTDEAFRPKLLDFQERTSACNE